MTRGVRVAQSLALCIIVVLGACKRGPATSSLPSRSSTALPPGDPQVHASAVVISRKGKVELQRGTSGSWADAQVGDRLAPSDALRTQVGEAEVGVDGVKVRVHQSSSVRLQDAKDRSLRAKVRGSIESEVEPGKGQLDVEVEGSDAHARSTGGHFFVTADGRGVVAVAAVTGSVNLTAQNQQVEVKQGEVGHVAGGAPVESSPALRRVLLSVQWPEERATRKNTVPVSGKVEAGSRVFIQGREIPVQPNGWFTAEVPLRDGKQKVAVLAIDPLGRRKQVDATIVRDQSEPTIKLTRKLWQSR
jgi:hypothetical protein